MFKHYFIIAWRNIVHHKFYSLILVIGLALGIATSVLLGMYTLHELSYDSFHEKKDRTYLVSVNQKEGTNEEKSGWTTSPTGPALQAYFPQIESMARLCLWFDDVIVKYGDVQLAEKKLVAADSSIFNVFTIPFIAGDPKTALKEPNSIVITQAAAKRYFKDEDPIGKTMQFEHFFHECIVTGVVEDYPDDSHFDFEMILSLSSLHKIKFDFTDSWENHTFITYITLHENSSAKDVEAKLDAFVKTNLDPYLTKKYHRSFDQIYSEGNYYKLYLTPLADVHLSTLVFENREGKEKLIYALMFLAVTILVLVCINYTNLASVLSFSRSKEAALRKVAGSGRTSLFLQFTVESVLIAMVGLIVGLGVIEVALPVFNQLTSQHLSIDYTDPKLMAILIGFTLVVGIISGLYPAFTLASGSPIDGLKSKTQHHSHRSVFRNVLVVFQFSICMVMIVSTLVVYRQLNFMMNTDPGFAMDQILVINRPGGLGDNRMAFKHEVLKNTDVAAVSFSETTPGRHYNGQGQHLKGDTPENFSTIYPMLADEDILKVLNLKIVAGKDFSEDKRTGLRAVINEATTKSLFIEKPLEAIIDGGTMGPTDIPVIGVVKDFHFKSFHHAIEPMIFYVIDPAKSYQPNHILVRVNTSNLKTVLPKIEKTWKALSSNYPFEYSFLDKDFQSLFERENITAKVYTVFCAISIAIACLGLLGLSSFFAEKRTKEIGIRKIVGASASNIALLLSKDFGKLLIISIILGSAVAWYLTMEWLDTFVYKTDLTWWVFVCAGVVIFLLAAVTVAWHLLMAANKNPVEVLKQE